MDICDDDVSHSQEILLGVQFQPSKSTVVVEPLDDELSLTYDVC